MGMRDMYTCTKCGRNTTLSNCVCSRCQPPQEPYSCKNCGRETRARGGYCYRCTTGRSGLSYYVREEERGRKRRRVTADADSPIEPVFENSWWERTAKEEYNGETCRDDV